MLRYKIYGLLHQIAKKAMNRDIPGLHANIFHTYTPGTEIRIGKVEGAYINTKPCSSITSSTSLFYGENTVDNYKVNLNESPKFLHTKAASPEAAWRLMLENATVPQGWLNSGFLQTGYISEKKNWCLSSWIWTTAAVARWYALCGDNIALLRIADAFIHKQEEFGGWVVRFDFNDKGAVPSIAPNDSAYIANNALLSAYRVSGQQKYLDAAEKCAEWIISTTREDGIVYIAKNGNTGEWDKNRNIVDIGFTAGLFAELYELTGKSTYERFAKQFVDVYISLFYCEKKHAFYTSIDKNNMGTGGYFGRGQAWALEGLIPVYRIWPSKKIKIIIDDVTNMLVAQQGKNGSWPYNFAKPLMGEDCKGIPVIARALLLWYELTGNEQLKESANKALDWCRQHTRLNGDCVGGIFSYSVEGAVVHDLYTSTAFTYSSSYALEAVCMIGGNNDLY